MNWIIAAQDFLSTGTASEEAYRTFPQLIAPFMPAIIMFVVVVAIEVAVFWTQRSTRISWWFPIALLSWSIFEITWALWSDDTRMTALVDEPGMEGLQFRLQLIMFAVLSLGVPLWSVVMGIRQAVFETALSGYAILLARIAAAPAIVVLIIMRTRDALTIFEGISFRIFY